MLNLLHIQNFAIIESLELEFGPGFTAITGETGAGKSILVDALGLLLGGRADTTAIRTGADKAELTAEFNMDAESAALSWLRAAELDQGNDCLLRRVIHEGGRSRAWINGTAVTLTQLQELGENLVEIHGQNEHMRLVQTGELFRLLDGSGHHDNELSAVAEAFAAWQAVELERVALNREPAMAEGELNLLQYQIDELQQHAVTTGMYAEMEAEHQLLARGSDVIQALELALELLQADETGIGNLLHQSMGHLQPAAALDRDIANALKALQEAAINSEEARVSVQSSLSHMELSPERLADLEIRMSRLHELGRKHRTEPGKLQEVLQQLRERCERAESLDQRRAKLERQQLALLKSYREAAGRLHQVRAHTAAHLSTAVTALMQELGMQGGSFCLAVEHDTSLSPSRRGDTRIEPLVSANPGIPPAPLRKVASGGELSRISLAVKVAASAGQPVPTQVFDEVDAGIGGDTANAVGRLLKSVAGKNVAGNGQALCVTHLAQVAVCADHQFRVHKTTTDAATQVDTSLLQRAERVDEIARMLGGKLSQQSRAHASELLQSAQSRN